MKRVERWMIVALLALCVLPAQAQLKFGVKGGLNVATVRFDRDLLDADNITGFQVGPMLELTVPILGVGFDAAVLYSKKGLSVRKENMSAHYMDIPVNLKWKLNLPLVKPYLAAGPYVGFRLGGDKVWNTNVIGDIQSQIETKSFSTGLNFGAGVELLNHLQVGFNYELGLSKGFHYSVLHPGHSSYFNPSDKAAGRSRGWSVTAAFLF